MSADDAMRWLETLAAQQGANADELVTTADERAERGTALPSWAAATEPVAEAPIATTPGAPAEADIDSMSADDAMRWLETLAAQQGASPDELVTTADERAERGTALPSWAAAEPMAEAPASVATTPGAPAEADIDSMSADDAMRWLETLAAQQGASPDELVTTADERAERGTALPTWAAATEPVLPASSVAPIASTPVAMPEPAPTKPEPLKPAPAKTAPIPKASTPEPPPAPAPEEKPEGAQSKLSRLAEQLAAKRRAKDDDIARRFEEQRAEKEAARREVQDKLEQKRRPGTGPLTLKPGTGGITRPGTGGIARPGTGGIARPGTGALTPVEDKATPEPASPAPVEFIPTVRPKRKVSLAQSGARPKKARLSKSPYAADAPDNVFSLAQQHLTDQEFAGAADAFTYLVSSGQFVDETITELETFIRIRPDATELWQVLGDAYMRVNRLQKALDAYRQALGQL